MKHHPQTVAGPNHSVSCITGTGITGAIAQPARHFPGTYKHTRADLYGITYPDADAAFAAMHARGYGQPYFRRRSVPIFPGNRHEEAAAAFDALDRYTKHARRTNHPHLLDILTARAQLAAKVAHGHPVARAITNHTDNRRPL